MSFSLDKDGDAYEQLANVNFLKAKFPAYEMYWEKKIVVLTGRDKTPPNIHFKTDAELSALGKGPVDVCLAQLNYTIIKHLTRAFILNQSGGVKNDPECFQEIFTRISSATDLADELLGRNADRKNGNNIYKPWDELDGRKARNEWREQNKYPLQDIRNYRNIIVHGRMLPTIIDYQNGPGMVNLYFPKIGKEGAYKDWRFVTSGQWQANKQDFDSSSNIIAGAFNRVLDYCNSNWMTHLLP